MAISIIGFVNLGTVVNTEEQTLEDNTASYKVLQTQERVLIKVAQKSRSMKHYPSFITSTDEQMSAHWKNGKPLKGGAVLNVYYYDIDKSDLGRNVVATVKVIEKTFLDGRQFVMLDIFKTPNRAPLYELKLPEGSNGGIPIPHTNQEVLFRPRSK